MICCNHIVFFMRSLVRNFKSLVRIQTLAICELAYQSWNIYIFLVLKILVCCVDDYVAHIKFTVLLMPKGSDCITSHSLQELQPTKTLDDPEIKAWLALGTKTKKKCEGKKKKGMAEQAVHLLL
ncbi:hypothetical protein HYC85_018792 [Camellia sinensis]|uniref:Uncharacterized protein n=1 Tax=Camellia sinensis TaxID=4442 RepID=A0A7J7GWT3_CAMSI|nr:hypothetical protein HYC85_018792 [Camellia sinensis]